MYIILTHNGKKDQTAMAEQIADMLEDDGHTIQHVVGSNDEEITLYTEDQQVIGNFSKVPDPDTLRFYVDIADENESN
ncbi:MAG TPA: hypothetical protein PKN48_00835 [Bacteroidales bacterium]|nr:hypothetical protein [Bacteroidales bacterium]